MIEKLLNNLCGVSVCDIKKSTVGAGSDTYFITSDSESMC